VARHPFELISARFGLRTLFIVMTVAAVAAWLSTTAMGAFFLGLFVTAVTAFLAIACWSWILGSLGEPRRHERLDTRDPAHGDD
jgi:hypothetical protein